MNYMMDRTPYDMIMSGDMKVARAHTESPPPVRGTSPRAPSEAPGARGAAAARGRRGAQGRGACRPNAVRSAIGTTSVAHRII